MNPRQERFITAMLTWLNDEVAPDGVVILADTPLFASRLLDSLRVLELIAYTEQVVGAVIPDSQIRMDNFQTVSRIASVFLREREGNSAAA
jgi:acyl carrier protein